MKIGIDVQAQVGRPTGLGVYARNLVNALLSIDGKQNEFFFYQKETDSRDLNTLERILWENTEVPHRARKDRVDLLHTPAFAPPWPKPCPTVVTVHDLIGLAFPNQMGWPSRFYWRSWLPARVRRADRMIAVSEHTKRDIVKYLGVDEKEITVIYPSGHEGFRSVTEERLLRETRERYGIKEKYLLAVGTLEPRKNLLKTIEAFKGFLKRRKSSEATYQLVVVGGVDFAHGKVFTKVVNDSPIEGEEIIFTGYVEQEVLNRLYSGAEAFVFCSLYEGFGIPLLEAMASGTPVITSRGSSLPEVAGDAALYVDPTDSNSITQAMLSVCENSRLREELIKKGAERIKQFSWEKTARRTMEVYQSLL